MNINFKLTKGKHMKLINLFFLLIFTTIALITLSNMVGCYKTSAAHTVTANNLKIETSEITNRPSINFEKPKKQIDRIYAIDLSILEENSDERKFIILSPSLPLFVESVEPLLVEPLND